MHIVIPILGFGRSGGYRVISELASAWIEAGCSTSIFVHYSSDLPYFPTQAKIIWLDDTGRQIDASEAGKAPKLRGHQHVLRNLTSLYKGLSRYGSVYDVVLANHSLTAWPVYLSRTSARKFYYIQAYEPEYYANRRGLSQRVLESISALSYLLPLKRIVNSPIYYKYKLVKAKDFVPPGIDFSVMSPKRETQPKADKPLIIGCIGRKEPEKGTQLVLDAFTMLVNQGEDVELRVAYGHVPEHLLSLPNCKVIIPNNDKELANFYQSLDILIAPGTLQLGAPHYPVMEAMACGTPVITTGYMPASIDADNAWIVPTNNVDAIVQAIHNIQANSVLRNQRVRQAIKDIQPFGWPNVANKMLEIFING